MTSHASAGAIVPVPASVSSTSARVLIADVSGSMQGRKYDRLKESLRRTAAETGASIIAFSDTAVWCRSVDHLPEPEGSTNLSDALRLASERFPAEVVVISDGHPNDPDDAIRAAAFIPGIISCVFIGDDGDGRGMEFMRRLARVGGGEAVHRDLSRVASIEDDVRGMLALDKPIAL